jgi:hypothetical protein
MPAAISLRTPLALVAALLLAGCGGETARNDSAETPAPGAAEDSAAAAAPAPAAAGSPTDAVSAPATVEDIDRWEKGIAGELAAVRKAAGRLESARTGEDTLSAMMGVQEMTTTPEGAKAAGLDQERYNVIRSNLSAAVSYLTPHVGGIDTTMLSTAQREEMRQMNAAQLKQLESSVPADVVEALKPRAEALRKQELELAAARLKGAGM